LESLPAAPRAAVISDRSPDFPRRPASVMVIM
jgi:hypothetical protein